MATKRAKRVKLGQLTEREKAYVDDEKRDGLSVLPDALIHHILSLIPSLDVVRMSVLSKRWRHVWCSLPELYFSESTGVAQNFDRSKFHLFVTKYLDRRKVDMLNVIDTHVTKFKLDMKWCLADTETIDFWLGSAICFSKVKELDLCIRAESPRKLYTLHLGLFSFNSFTTVKLCGVVLGTSTSISFPHLISLSLENVRLGDQVLDNLLTGSHSLERLVIKECANLSYPRVSNSSLKILEIVLGPRQTIFEVEALNLQSFVYGGGLFYCDFNVSFCETLQHLSISNMKFEFEDDWLEDLIYGLPLLESLSLCNCKLSHIKILSQKLKYFFFRGNKSCHVLEATMDTPNLVSFSYEGYLLINCLITAPSILQANIKLHNPRTYGLQWYFNFLDLLINLGCSNSLRLNIYSVEALIFPSKFRRTCRCPLPNLKHLKIMIDCPLRGLPKLKHALLWVSPSLKSLSVELNPDYFD